MTRKATAASPCPAGAATIAISNPDGGTASTTTAFTYNTTSVPTITTVSPGNGSPSGNTPVLISGTQFQTGAVTPPAAYAGTVSVVLTNRDGSTATLANAFTYTSSSGPGDPNPTDPNDTDGDGLPNDCETKFGLDPNSAVGADGADGDPDNDGRSNLVECGEGTHPRGFFTRYLAEGATGPFFDMFIALLNSRDQDARTLVRYQTLVTTTPEPSDYLVVPAQRRRTINPENIPALAQTSFSTIIESDVQVIAERNMQWGNGHYGSHSETSSAAPSTIRYFAEGATHGTFNLFYLFQNPNDAATNVTVTYMRPTPQPPIVKTYAVAAKSRGTITTEVSVYSNSNGVAFNAGSNAQATRIK